MQRYRDAKCTRNLRESQALRVLTDHLWIDEYVRAAERIMDRHRRGKTWCKVWVPVACDLEMQDWYEWVLEVASWAGYERRPGGNQGPGYDLVYLERPTVAATGVRWSQDELNGVDDDL